jgi:hypothetical protein
MAEPGAHARAGATRWPQPHHGEGTILGFSAGAGDDSLPLGRPGDQVVPEEHGITRRGATSVRAASPVGIGLDDQVRAGRAA